MWKHKLNEPFSFQLAVSVVFHHSSTNPKTGGLMVSTFSFWGWLLWGKVPHRSLAFYFQLKNKVTVRAQAWLLVLGCNCCGRQKRVSQLLERELELAMSCATWVLETKLGSSARATETQTLSHLSSSKVWLFKGYHVTRKPKPATREDRIRHAHPASVTNDI